MTALPLIIALLGAHTHATAPELAEAIDLVCDGDRECVMDAVATCYVETRCQLGHCGRNGCGPFQQLARYADDTPELVPLTHAERREALNGCAVTATRQWLAVRDRYAARWGGRWPWRYNGSANAERYNADWWTVRRRMERMR